MNSHQSIKTEGTHDDTWIYDKNENLDLLCGYSSQNRPNIISVSFDPSLPFFNQLKLTNEDIDDDSKKTDAIEKICERLKGNVGDLSFSYKTSDEKV